MKTRLLRLSTRPFLGLVAALAVALVLAGTPPAGAVGPAASAVSQSTLDAADGGTVEVTMLDDRFVGARVTVKAGTTVTWLNAGNHQHDTMSMDGLWLSPSLASGESFSFTFDAPGVYQYFCRPHFHLGMRGTITVEE